MDGTTCFARIASYISKILMKLTSVVDLKHFTCVTFGCSKMSLCILKNTAWELTSLFCLCRKLENKMFIKSITGHMAADVQGNDQSFILYQLGNLFSGTIAWGLHTLDLFRQRSNRKKSMSKYQYDKWLSMSLKFSFSLSPFLWVCAFLSFSLLVLLFSLPPFSISLLINILVSHYLFFLPPAT